MIQKAQFLRVASILFALCAVLLPNVAFAETTTLTDIFCKIGTLVDLVTPIVAALALLAFFWGLTMYLFSLSGGEGSTAHSSYGMPATPQNKTQGRTIMVYGVIVLFVMFSIWGIVNLLQNSFGVGNGQITPPSLPGVPAPSIPSGSC